MKRISPYLGILTAFLIFGCKQSTHPAVEEIQGSDQKEDQEEAVQEINAFQLLQTSCFNCHSPNPKEPGNAGPTMADVHAVYLENYSEKAEYVSAISEFVVKPKKKNALMKDAVMTYGVMPAPGIKASQANAIGNYLFESDIHTDGWYQNRFELEKAKYAVDPSEMSYIDRGFQYAMATKGVLGKNLKGKLKEAGSLGALTFCNVRAIPLTDSMAMDLNVHIKRVSDKPRNPNNQANENELDVISAYKNQLKKGEEIDFRSLDAEENFTGYYPIVTNEMCLKCHGTDTDIQPATLKKLKELYPNDKARGYGENQLRGIWVVEMKK